jgi:thiamine monophosphate synthase
VIQVREKDKTESEVEQIVAAIVRAVSDPLKVTVNGFPGIAQEMGTNLHLPDHDLRRRANLPLARGALMSRSIHDLEFDSDADYLILGNLLETTSKPGKAGIGPKAFGKIAAAAPVPVLAVGGIGPRQVRSALAAGANGVAVRSFVIGADDPEVAAHSIRTEIDQYFKGIR